MPDKWAQYAQPTQGGDKWAQYAAPASPVATSAPTTVAPPTVGGYLKNVGIGAARGVASTLGNIDQMVGKTKIGQALNTPISSWFDPNGMTADQATQKMVQHGVPQNGMQSLGKGIEQAGEFLIPGGAEEGLLSKAPGAARIAAQALSTGVVNKAQGGGFGVGAAAGAAGGALGQGMKAVAPVLAESALGVRAADRAYGRTPGQAILNETTGIKPGNIAKQAQDKLDGYMLNLQDAASKSANPVDLGDARLIARDTQSSASSRNNNALIKQAGQLGDQLHVEAGTSTQIPAQVSALRALDLKRGVGDLKGSWNPATTNKFMDGAVGHVYNALDRGIDSAVPEASALNQKMSTLIPVAARADAADLNANALQRVVGRVARPTGALIGATGGGYEGYKTGGVPGALAGAAAGLILPEILASPTTLMGEARGLASPVTNRYMLPAAIGAALQANRKKN